MTLKYLSGEIIAAGDLVEYHGEPGRVEFVATSEDPAYAWYVERFDGGGVMIATPAFGSLFLDASDIMDDLTFRARQEPPE